MKYTISVLIGLLGLTCGIGFVHITQAATIGEHTIQIRALEAAQARSDLTYEARLGNVVKLWEEQLKTERELISLVREQIRVIERGNNGK